MKYKNNPFNIRRGSSHWLGSISNQGDQFESFDTLEHGIRAFFIILRTYSTKYGRNTIRSIITRFAPPSENNVERYINYVCERTNMAPDDMLTSWLDYIPLAQSMALFESSSIVPFVTLYNVWTYYHIENKSFPSHGIIKPIHECETFNDLPF